MSSILVTIDTQKFDSVSSSVLLLPCSLNKLDNSVFYQFGEAGDSVCVSVYECVSSKLMLKEDINWRSSGADMTLTSGWIIKGAAWRRV